MDRRGLRLRQSSPSPMSSRLPSRSRRSPPGKRSRDASAERLPKGRAYRPLEAWSRPHRHQPRRWDRPPPVGRGSAPRLRRPSPSGALAGHDLEPDLPRRRPAHPRRRRGTAAGVCPASRTPHARGRRRRGHPIPERLDRQSLARGLCRILDQIAEHIGPAHGLFLPSFSTTVRPRGRRPRSFWWTRCRSSSMIASQHWSAGFRRSPSRGPSPTGSGLSANGSETRPRALPRWRSAAPASSRQFATAAAGQVDTGFWNRFCASRSRAVLAR